MIRFEKNKMFTEQWIPRSMDEVFPFFSDPKNLERITPPWLNFQIVHQTTPQTQLGTQIEYKLSMHGLPMRWKSEITEWEPGKRFADNQLKGPYRKWYHVHRFSVKDGGVLMQDEVEFALPMGFLGNLFLPWVKMDLRKIFSHRMKVIEETFMDKKA